MNRGIIMCFAQQVSALLAGWVASQPGGALPVRVRLRSSSSEDRGRTTGVRNEGPFSWSTLSL